MPQQHSRLDARRARRRKGRSNSTLIAVAGLAVVILLAGAGFWGFRAASHGRATATAATSPAPAKAASSAPAQARQEASPSPAAATEASATAPDPAAVAAAGASSGAAEKAAVPFPGAPAISATTPSVNHLKPRHKYIAITLDDGYNYQPALLDLFKQYDVRCTTFIVGSWAAGHKDAIQQMKDAGFEIANHSWTHPFLTKLSTSAIKSELTKTQRVLSSVTGNQAPYLRPPFGATNPKVKAAAASLGYRIVMWDRTFGDSGRGATPKKLYSNVMYSGGGVQPGDIILCHWGSKPSYEALKKIIPDLKAQGYEFVTVSELIADSK